VPAAGPHAVAKLAAIAGGGLILLGIVLCGGALAGRSTDSVVALGIPGLFGLALGAGLLLAAGACALLATALASSPRGVLVASTIGGVGLVVFLATLPRGIPLFLPLPGIAPLGFVLGVGGILAAIQLQRWKRGAR
jgi:hypothetical protein